MLTPCPQHTFIIIFHAPSPDAPDGEDVVRWCSTCGAVTVDTDIDNRIYSGRIMRLRLPHLLGEG
jgi:hypothetical protein